MTMRRWISRGLAVLAIPSLLAMQAAAGEPAAFASQWATEHASRARLVAGSVKDIDGTTRLMAAVEIELHEGWKTYWRHPGTSGVPPRFDWTGSDNLAKADVIFPAPLRFRDRDGDIIGYKTAVTLPVELTPAEPGRAMSLKLNLEYGVCKDVCIPVQSDFVLQIPENAKSQPAGDAVSAALARVPRTAPLVPARDPKLGKVAVDLAGDKPRIVIDAAFPGNPDKADAFLEAPDGLWLPMAQRADGPAGMTRFVVDLTDGVDINDVKGQTIRLTLVSEAGQAEASFILEQTP
ncbi:MAG TPA: protein-disulfide reductase DsbD domain-containing protein [Hyphomicrobiaceae bacterium]|nr:protein-disulfide reductase DsbD domain-containing protein [Hyphomicrobiaceae bacterium]